MGTITDKHREFLVELRALLFKHKAMISLEASPCSDWHGINEATMSFQLGGISGIVPVSGGTCLSAHDITPKGESVDFET